ncbi:MAG TPA: glycosyl hydrolase family 8 [Nitrospiria bacterium]|nr:glycosyl hydrolase family 8 [Nitrospiria bacterium]
MFLAAFLSIPCSSAQARTPDRPSDAAIRQVDELSALWSFYKHTYIATGRVISLDEQGVTTSEGQGYAMLRAVWSNDRLAFASAWQWTKQHLQVRNDHLFAWKWKGQVLSLNSATDADTDIALALILASRRFSEPAYEHAALDVLDSIWNKEIAKVGRQYYVTAGNWAVNEDYPAIHVAYLAPYAYEIFASVDDRYPWKRLVDSSYEILHWIYFEQGLRLPPEILFLDKQTGRLLLKHPRTGESASFSYDAFPIFWRVALDARWFGRPQSELRRKMLAFFQDEWRTRKAFFDRYSIRGEPLSRLEGLPLYATVHALALEEDQVLAGHISRAKLDPLRQKALGGNGTPYYLHNWLWFGRAFELQALRTYDEFLGFLRPFDFKGFSAHFPWALFAVTIALFFLVRVHPRFKLAFLVCGFSLCGYYLVWRLFNTLNFVESAGPFISLSLWGAELYAFSTVLLLLVQVGLGGKQKPQGAQPRPGFSPSVDILIPIYSESCEILAKTLVAARAIDYADKRIYVLDDGHRPEVARVARRFGATYIEGPRTHAKAGNLNHALGQTDGELVAVFDTDHIPVTTFLQETVPFFVDPKMAVVQTPHHFYNPDIFQRAFGGSERIPNEQDMFNHAIQNGRDAWNGAFFVGSGAVFRRSALADVNGFNLMSITEDIHTSQHLHAAGWRSAFLDKDLAVGLAAENLSSYLGQRRRWMLGCLQIFFKDNPLIRQGLTTRQRLGYFASLYYFFFPVARVVFWITPLYFLLFHFHPILSDVSVLVAYLLPFIIVLPLIASTLLPGWPRLFWASVYEAAVSFQLFRSMFDLFLPKQLGFKVTPKGLRSHRRAFDFNSSTLPLIATGITLVAIAKGLWEFFYFGIEKDAYFFNLSWASLNLLFLLMGLLVAWERPQQRTEERIRKSLPFELESAGVSLKGTTHDLSVSGLSFMTAPDETIPLSGEVTLGEGTPIRCRYRVVYHDCVSRQASRCGIAFLDLPHDDRCKLIVDLFADAGTWNQAHATRVRGNLPMAFHLFRGIVRCLRPLQRRTRTSPRSKTLRRIAMRVGSEQRRALLRDWSSRGIGILHIGKEWPSTMGGELSADRFHDATFQEVYCKRLLPRVWRIGLRIATRPVVQTIPAPVQGREMALHQDH